jgi:hypothetical protein
MKIIFEEEDIEAGMYVICNSYPKESTNYEFATTVMYKIGWIYDKHQNKYCFISLADGMINVFENKKEMAERLNRDKGYRVLNIIEMTDILRKAYIKSVTN